MGTMSKQGVQRLCSVVVVLAVWTAGCGGGDDGGSGITPPVATRGTVSGSVVDDGGVAVADAAVQLSRAGQSSRSATTGADGAFTVAQVEAGSWLLDVAPPTGFTKDPVQLFPVTVAVVANQTASATLRLRRNAAPGAIQGTARAAGAAVPGAVVTLDGGATATTSAAGGFGFAAVAPGPHTVAIAPPSGFALAAGESASKSVSVAAGATATVDFQLQATSSSGVQVIHLTSSRTFSPAQVTIAKGTTVRWTSDTPVFHTVTPNGHSQWSEASFSATGATFEHTFTSAGTFDYYCSPHRNDGMTGRIVVQ